MWKQFITFKVYNRWDAMVIFICSIPQIIPCDYVLSLFSESNLLLKVTCFTLHWYETNEQCKIVIF